MISENFTTLKPFSEEKATNSSSENKVCTDIEDDLAMHMLEICIGVTSLCGIIANILNIVIFKMRAGKDGTCLSLLCLSVTDLMCTLMSFIASVGYCIVHLYRPTWRTSWINMSNFLITGCLRTVFSQMSMHATVILSVERCLCIIKPFTFKNLVTKRRTAIVLSISYVEAMFLYVLLITTRSYTWKCCPPVNATVFISAETELYTRILNIHYKLNGLVMTFLVITVSVFVSCVTLVTLRRASKFRQQRMNSELGNDSCRTGLGSSAPSLRSVSETQQLSNISERVPYPDTEISSDYQSEGDSSFLNSDKTHTNEGMSDDDPNDFFPTTNVIRTRYVNGLVCQEKKSTVNKTHPRDLQNCVDFQNLGEACQQEIDDFRHSKPKAATGNVSRTAPKSITRVSGTRVFMDRTDIEHHRNTLTSQRMDGPQTKQPKQHNMSRTSSRDYLASKTAKVAEKDAKLIKMLFILLVIFVIANIPLLVKDLVRYSGISIARLDIAWHVSRVFVAVNASINIVVYYKMNASYTQNVRALLTCRRQTVPNRSSITLSSERY